MYSYNRYSKHLHKQSLQASEAIATQTNAVAPHQLKGDQRLMTLLNVGRGLLANTANYYSAIYNDDSPVKNDPLVRTLYMDELKDLKRLQEAEFLITQNTPTTALEDLIVTRPQTTGLDLLEETLMLEMDNCKFFCDLLLSLPASELRDILYELIVDAQNHASLLNFLMSKYYGQS